MVHPQVWDSAIWNSSLKSSPQRGHLLSRALRVPSRCWSQWSDLGPHFFTSPNDIRSPRGMPPGVPGVGETPPILRGSDPGPHQGCLSSKPCHDPLGVTLGLSLLGPLSPPPLLGWGHLAQWDPQTCGDKGTRQPLQFPGSASSSDPLPCTPQHWVTPSVLGAMQTPHTVHLSCPSAAGGQGVSRGAGRPVLPGTAPG